MQLRCWELTFSKCNASWLAICAICSRFDACRHLTGEEQESVNAIFPLDTSISQFAVVTLLLVSMCLFTLDPRGTQHVHGQRNHFDHDGAPSVRLGRVDEQRWMGEGNNAHDHSSKPTRGTKSIFCWIQKDS